ncbi:MAG: GMC family oxidoreductase N-terminal domain-containing protein [Desulfosudis oleivorans]|nr:GMC family oxidoreductase N-terminal domain-containing protein [Desulfosudis oleivorans]
MVVLEEGPVVSSKDFTGSIKESFKHLYRNTGTDTTTGIPSILIATGKCLGRTTWSTWAPASGRRPHPSRLEGTGACGLRPGRPRALLRRGRGGDERAAGQARGDGPRRPDHRRRGHRLGLHPKPIRRNVNNNCHGCGNCAYGCEQDAKQSMILNAIPDAEGRRDLLLRHPRRDPGA